VQGTCETPEDTKKAVRQIAEAGKWVTIVPMSPLGPGEVGSSQPYFTLPSSQTGKRFTHIKLNYFLDGGVARLRV